MQPRKRQRIIGKELNDLWKLKSSMLCPMGQRGKKQDNKPGEASKFHARDTLTTKDA